MSSIIHGRVEDTHDVAEAASASSCVTSLITEFDRFKIWSANVGAHRMDNSSLNIG